MVVADSDRGIRLTKWPSFPPSRPLLMSTTALTLTISPTGQVHFQPSLDAAEPSPTPDLAQDLPRDLRLRATFSGLEARARQDVTGVTVLTGSRVNRESKPTLRSSLVALRETLLADGFLTDAPSLGTAYRLTHDQRFDSLSGASCFVMGYGCHGAYFWRGPDGRRLRDSGE